PMGPSIDAVGGIASPALANVRVIADSRNNALLIMATPAEYKMVEQAVQKLDMVPLQVQIEATIVEVSLNDELRYGVQWFLKKGAGSFTLSDAASGAVAPIFPGFSFMAKHADMRVVLNALESITDVNVVSSPSLMVLDNRMARLQVGDEVPVATQSAMSVLNPEAPIVNTIAFRQTGVILEVTPHVNSGGMCILEITQEVSDVAQTVSSGIDSPTIRQRGVQSTVAVHSGETIALGGLIRDNRSRGQDGVPFLQHLPVIGAAFRSTNDNHARTELLVLLTPRVIRSMDEARQATEEMRRRMHSILPAEKQ
ncbi:MAG: type II secretion system protein GspD, partial [Rhodospirillales bacterium]|nr:type II secretion system protein GspD [Rhodospirillales bacterium]